MINAYHNKKRGTLSHACIIELEDNISFDTLYNFLLTGDDYFYLYESATLAIKPFSDNAKNLLLEQNGFSLWHSNQSKNAPYYVRSATSPSDNFTVIPFSKKILHISDGTGTFCTLVRGKTHALLIDTSWGVADLRTLVEKLIRTPYTIVNTHAHPDHVFGNCLFEKVLTPEKDKDVYEKLHNYDSNRDEYFKDEESRKFYTKLDFPPFSPLKAGTVFDLGDLHVQTIPLYSHTHGSLGFLIEEEHILVAGDAINTHIWLFMKESLPLKECVKTYQEALKLDFDKIIGSHAKVMWSKSLIQTVIKNIDQVLSPTFHSAPENFEKIMDYNTTSVFYSDEENSSWVTVRE